MSFSLFSWSYLSYAAIAYLVFVYIRSYITEQRFRKFEEENGCEKPKSPIRKLPWGVDTIFRFIMASSRGEDIFEDIIIPGFGKIDAFTTEATGLMGHKFISTAEPKNVQTILATRFKDYETGERRRKQFGALLGRSIFNSDGDAWAHSRAVFRPVFNRESINNLEDTERAVKILIDVLPRGEKQWTAPVELLDYFYRFTLDTATAFLFGSTVDSQLSAAGRLTGEVKGSVSSLAVDQEFVDAFAVAQDWLALRIKLQALYWLIWSPRYRRAVATVRSFISHYVKLALDQQAEYEKAEGGEAGKYNLLRELARETRDPTQLRDELLAILGAGRDTTAVLLGWVFVELARNPKVFHRLRSTILSDFGNATSKSSPLSFSKLKSCRYLQFVINETLRLHPIIPVNNRCAVRNTVLPVGGGRDGSKPVAVRKGQYVSFLSILIHRRRDIWGENAEEFIPERWDGRKIDWSYTPFSGGPRICLGQQYAITEASLLIVRMLQQFDAIEWVGAAGRVRNGLALTMFPADGVPVRLRRAVE